MHVRWTPIHVSSFFSPAVAVVVYRVALVLGGIAWVLLASTLCGCNSVNGYVMNRSGQAYYNRGNYTAARYEFERALIDQPNNPHYAYNVAKAMRQQGDTAGAEQMYQHAINIDPTHQPAYHDLAEMLMDQGREDDASALLTAWSETQPYIPEAQLEMANLYQQQGNYAAAQQKVQQAMHANPSSSQAYAQLAQYYEAQGNPQMAAQYYERSILQNPYRPEVHSQYGRLATRNRPSGALYLSHVQPRVDPTFAGGIRFTNPQMATPAAGTYMSSPAMNSTVMMAPTQGQVVYEQPMMGTTAPQQMSAPWQQQSPQTIMTPSPYATTPQVQSVPAAPSIPPSALPGGSNPQPIELGQPVPITHMYPQYNQPIMGQPVMSQPIVTQPTLNAGVPVMQAF